MTKKSKFINSISKIKTHLEFKQQNSYIKKYLNQIFKSLFQGNVNNQVYYPFSKLNNISLFRYDSSNNTQLYQCLNCQEYIFSDKCPNLQSKYTCQRCSKDIVKGNPNTQQVLQNANTNQNALNNIINQNQWKGLYMRLMKGITDDQLNQGNTLDLRIFTLMYSISIILSLQKNNQKEIIENNNLQALNEFLKIYYQNDKKDIENFLNEQIDLAIEQIFEIIRFQDIKEQDIKIVIFKILNTLLNDSSIQIQNNPEQRAQLNTDLSIKIQDIINQSKEVFFNQKQGEVNQIKVFEKFEFKDNQLKLQNYYKNLRYVKVNYETNFIQTYIQSQTQNNQQYQQIKQILDPNKLDYLSRSLKILVQFTQQMQKYLNNKFTRRATQEVTLLNALEEQDNHQLFILYSDSLFPLWKENYEKEKKFRIGCRTQKIYELTLNTKLQDLIYQTKKEDGIFSNILEMLCSQQNNLIQSIQSLVNPENDPSKKQVNAKVKTIESLDHQLNIIKSSSQIVFRKYFMNSLEYGQGNTYIFDLQQLQEELIQISLTGAAIIDLENSAKFSFLPEINDLGYLSYIEIEQEPISLEVKQNLKQVLQSKEQMYDLLNQLIRIFQFYKKSKDKKEISLKQAFDDVKMQLKMPKLIAIMSEKLKLKHLNSLICALEEFNIDNLVNLCDPIYKQDLIKPENIQRVRRFIQSSKLEESNFQIALGRFIFRYLSKEGLAPNSRLFEQLFDDDISEIWNDNSLIQHLQQEANRFDILIKESFSLYQNLKQPIIDENSMKSSYYQDQDCNFSLQIFLTISITKKLRILDSTLPIINNKYSNIFIYNLTFIFQIFIQF